MFTTKKVLVAAAIAAVVGGGGARAEPETTVLDGGVLEPHVSVGLGGDIPAEMMAELSKHVSDFLDEIRPGITEELQKEIMEFKVAPELEALTVAQHYFENPETSVLAERMLSVCESDMKNCPLLQHIPEEERVGSQIVFATEEEGEEAGLNGRKLQQEKVPVSGNPDTKVPFLNVPNPPISFGAVSSFQFYRDLYCTPPIVNPAEFDFISETSFEGVTYAFAVLGGGARWDPKTQQLTVNKPQVVYSKRPSSWSKSGGSTTKGSATEKSCDFSSAIQKKSGEGIGYSQVLGIEEQFFKPTANTPIYIDALKPDTYPSLRGWFRCWIDQQHPECTPPDIALSPLLLNLPLQILSFLPGLGILGK
ncbi:hypothetical protein HOP50_10g60920 [Chloropicon primus]|uniref:Uncharacterized protein n=1 Tax=Chloropicon primus TaxID=1764295 RepID=A0A5B8MSR2_9CHLO|nr:hypothetical protein A3770_10p60710 [Chloropicon primus]UPR02765.1 hypothetical protein HOP50_10g60920 [Chloropicon primus]|eukprot:QDZ23553.1 hypothetical protein A3770_10p60710 [Chloropicon primus]